jgi:DNA polymerase-3 subunit chi
MTKVIFIEVTTSRMEMSACQIAERTYLEGGKLQIIAPNQQQAVRLDDFLWTFRPDSFVPHSFFGGEKDELLPAVVITTEPEKIPGFESLLMLDFCPVETVAQFSQAIHLVIVDNRERLAASRDYWIQLKEAGLKLIHQKRQPG